MPRYKISYKNPDQHYIDIEFEVQSSDSSKLYFQLPAWRPGRYKLGNFAKNIQHFSATNEKGEELACKKVTKDQWEVTSESSNLVKINYNYYANELNAGSTFLDRNQLYVNPVNCFIYQVDCQEEVCELRLEIPDDYRVAGSLEELSKNYFKAKDFHELVDSPFIASNSLQHDYYEFEGVKYCLWFQGICKPNFEKIKQDFIQFTEAQIKLFSDFPTKVYHFLFQILPHKSYHGVEHQNSTVIALGPTYELMEKGLYDELLGVSSHELFHTWNIKNIRPNEMCPYDYSKESYSNLGYVAEGVTTYYGDLMLLRSGVFSEEKFFKIFNKTVQRHYDNFGRLNYSVAQSSFDTWLDGYQMGVPDRKVSIYNEGSLISFMCDVLMMKQTANKYSLDDVMLKLYKEFGKKNKGYAESDYKSIIEGFTQNDWTDFFEKYIWGNDSYLELLSQCFDHIGYEVVEKKNPEISQRILGVKTYLRGESTAVLKVQPNSLGYDLGIHTGQTIKSINGFTIEKDLENWLQFFVGEEVKIEITDKNVVTEVVCNLDDTNNFYPIQELSKAKHFSEDNFKHWALRHS